jgi:hypothetical protein
MNARAFRANRASGKAGHAAHLECCAFDSALYVWSLSHGPSALLRVYMQRSLMES